MPFLELPTLMTVAIFATICNALIMFMTWLASRKSKHYAMWSIAFVCLFLTIVLLGGRGRIPDSLSIVGANLLAFVAHGLLWLGLRAFGGRLRQADVVWVLAGPVAWIAFSFDHYHFGSMNNRVFFMASLTLGYTLAALTEALATYRRQALPALVALTGLLTIHSTSLAFKMAAVIIMPLPEDFNAVPKVLWFAVVSLEGLINVIFIGTALLACCNQATEWRLRAAAQTDPLTGLYNRRTFATEVRQRLRNTPTAGALVLFDLDHFKAINDSHGHAAGDAALMKFSEVVSSQLAPHDIFARMGGEEFALYLHGASIEAAVASALALTRKIASSEMVIFSKTMQITTSAGVAAVAEVGNDLDGLLIAADEALYEAKRTGRNRVVAFSKARSLRSVHSAVVTGELAAAI